MDRLLRNKFFIFGYLGGILAVVGLNLLTVLSPSICKDCPAQIGFPFAFYRRVFTKCNSTPEASADIDCFIWYFSEIRLVADIFTALIFSFVLGLIFKALFRKTEREY